VFQVLLVSWLFSFQFSIRPNQSTNMTSRTAVIILNYVCPIIGVFFTNYMCLAPLKDLDTAVRNAQGLNGLNPTPWAFMLGNCLGWTAYALLSNDYYIFLADAPGFLISCWLNLGAVKLLYSAHHQKETRKSLVAFLQKNDLKMSEEIRKSQFQQAVSYYDSHSDDEDDNDDDDVLPGYDDDKEDKTETEISESVLEESKDAITPLYSSLGSSINTSRELKSSLRFGKQKSAVSFGKQKSAVSFGDQNGEEVSMAFTAIEEGEKDPEPNEENEKSMTQSMVFTKSKSRFGLFSQKSKKLANMHKSLGHMATSFAKRTEKLNEWGEVVWNVTSQQQPAKAPHEKLVMGLIILWFVTLSVLGFFSHYDKSEDKNRLSLLVIGYVVMVNQIFFYGAPLSRINQVVRTRKSDCIHFQSLIANTLNSSLWFAYGIAPQVADPFIWGPCALGLLFAAIQFVCCAVFPRTKQSEEEIKRFSITSMLVSQSAIGYRRSSVDQKSIEETSKTMGSVSFGKQSCDVEENKAPEAEEAVIEEYMTSYGHYSYMF